MVQPLTDQIHILYKHKTVKTFSDVMNFVSKSELAKALHSSNKTIAKKINDNRLFTVGDVIEMAKVFGMAPGEVFGLLLAE